MIHFELNKGASRIIIKKTLKKLGRIIFKEFKKSGVISIAAVSGNRIKKINKEYRKKDKSTDILTFVLDEKDCLGEIILSYKDAEKRAKKSGKSIKETAVYLIIHGACHIFGYGHKGKQEAIKMEKMEEKILNQCYGRK